MIELYVIVTLLGLGYILRENQIPETNDVLDQNDRLEEEIPSHINVYESKRVEVVQEDEIKRGKDHFETVKSKLSGMDISFTHNNMQPFYRGTLKHEMKSQGNILETYGTTSLDDNRQPKREQENMFLPQQNINNINGMKNKTGVLQQRFNPSLIQNNVLPFKQERIGPAIDSGFCATGNGGFQQFEIQEIARQNYYDVDKTRVLNNPKKTYEGRVLEGKHISKPTKEISIEKNRPDTYYEQTPDMYFKTTGANLKESKRPEFPDLKEETERELTSTEYQGAPAIVGAKKVTDYGKAGILLDSNERDKTGNRTYESNISTIFKAFITPILDVIKSSKKELSVTHPRQNGNIQSTASVPYKMTVKDPNDILRTTIKETLIHDTRQGNFKGSIKSIVKDPNDVTRTTLKETLIHDTVINNLNPRSKNVVVYDPKEIAKTTIRQTTCSMEYDRNIQPSKHGSVIYDPSSVAKVTVKETTLSAKEGNINAKERVNQGYLNEIYDMKSTEKEHYSNNDRIGGANQDNGRGYDIANYEAKHTEKENPEEYIGTGVDTQSKQTMSYDNIYNAEIDKLKETVIIGNDNRSPTLSGVKVSNNDMNLSKQRYDDNVSKFLNHGTPIQNTFQSNTCGVSYVTKTRNDYENKDRLDLSVMALNNSLKTNPYVQNINTRPE